MGGLGAGMEGEDFLVAIVEVDRSRWHGIIVLCL